MNHLLLHCWSCFSLFGVLGYDRFGKGFPLRLAGSFLAKDKRRIWKLGPLCIFWMVWKARNGIVFRDEVLSIQRLKSSFVHLLWLETKVFFYGWSHDACSFL